VHLQVLAAVAVTGAVTSAIILIDGSNVVQRRGT
jgi:hypothetical protein